MSLPEGFEMASMHNWITKKIGANHGRIPSTVHLKATSGWKLNGMKPQTRSRKKSTFAPINNLAGLIYNRFVFVNKLYI